MSTVSSPVGPSKHFFRNFLLYILAVYNGVKLNRLTVSKH